MILSLINLGTILLISPWPDNEGFRIYLKKIAAECLTAEMFVKKYIGNWRKLYHFLQLTVLTDFQQNNIGFIEIYLYLENKSFIDNLDWNFRLSFTNVKNKHENCFLFSLYLPNFKGILFEISISGPVSPLSPSQCLLSVIQFQQELQPR